MRRYILSHTHDYGVTLWPFETDGKVPEGTYNCTNIEEYPECAEQLAVLGAALGATLDFSDCTEEVHIGEVSEFQRINL